MYKHVRGEAQHAYAVRVRGEGDIVANALALHKI